MAQAGIASELTSRWQRLASAWGAPPAVVDTVYADVVTRYGAWPDHDVLVSGSPAMVRSTVSRMLVAGTPLDRIMYDPFTVD